MKTDGILFDLDGTLWDSVDEIVSTWNQTLKKTQSHRTPITRAELETLMGLQMDEIARKLFPLESDQRQKYLMEQCIQEENRFLYYHGAKLYPNVRETLNQLKKNYQLYIVSNCQSGYIEAFLHAHSLNHLFNDYLCFGDTERSKGENINYIIHRNSLKSPIYVGDTQGDCDAAAFANISFIYAEYGFGHVTQYDEKIRSFGDLLRIFNK